MELDKRLKYEGDPFSKITQAMRSFGRNESSTVVLGTITAAPPEIEMMIDNDSNVYDKHDIYVAERLTAHGRVADISSALVSVAMSSEGYTPHTHAFSEVTLQDAVISYTDELAVGDRVLVECDDENMRYIIIDRVVSYA